MFSGPGDGRLYAKLPSDHGLREMGRTTMIRKMMMASLAWAVAAFAVPSLASADWTDNTVRVNSQANITFSGNKQFFSAIGGVSCTEAHANATITPGTTGHINSDTAVVASCKGTGGLAGCTVTSFTSFLLPWTAHTNGSAIEVTGLDVHITFHGGFCPYHEVALAGNVTTTPNNAHGASSFTAGNVAGALELYNGTTGATISTVTTSGTLNITPGSTYGIT